MGKLTWLHLAPCDLGDQVWEVIYFWSCSHGLIICLLQGSLSKGHFSWRETLEAWLTRTYETLRTLKSRCTLVQFQDPKMNRLSICWVILCALVDNWSYLRKQSTQNSIAIDGSTWKNGWPCWHKLWAKTITRVRAS